MLVLSAQVPEQPGIPPYWPWVQVLRQLTQLLDEQELRDVLGPGACCIADICPELRDRLPDLPLPQPLADPGQARFRLFDAMAQAWRRVAAARPVLLILDDLHWADPSSLHLLEFCAGELADCRALIVATARDADGSDQQPVRNALADLQRKMRRLSLTGLSREQTGLLATAIAGTAIPDAVIGFVHGRTAGNPFFVSELARWLVQQGMLAGADLVPGVDPARPLRRLPGRHPCAHRRAPGSPVGDDAGIVAACSGDRRAVQLRPPATSVRRPLRGPAACRARSRTRRTDHRRAERARLLPVHPCADPRHVVRRDPCAGTSTTASKRRQRNGVRLPAQPRAAIYGCLRITSTPLSRAVQEPKPSPMRSQPANRLAGASLTKKQLAVSALR